MQGLHLPIKRSHELRPLSREHHDGLLFVWKIRQGISKGVSPARLGSYCAWYWQNYLLAHMKQEETLLGKVLPNSQPLMYNMLDDHAAIKTKMEQVIEDPTYDSLARLAQIIFYHIRFEERFLFPAIERTATREQLALIGAATAKQHTDPHWSDEFWIGPRRTAAPAA